MLALKILYGLGTLTEAGGTITLALSFFLAAAQASMDCRFALLLQQLMLARLDIELTKSAVTRDKEFTRYSQVLTEEIDRIYEMLGWDIKQIASTPSD